MPFRWVPPTEIDISWAQHHHLPSKGREEGTGILSFASAYQLEVDEISKSLTWWFMIYDFQLLNAELSEFSTAENDGPRQNGKCKVVVKRKPFDGILKMYTSTPRNHNNLFLTSLEVPKDILGFSHQNKDSRMDDPVWGSQNRWTSQRENPISPSHLGQIIARQR